MINRGNYEIYFLDYYENRLTDEQARLLLNFIENNPDLKEEFLSFENVSMENNEIEFPKKSFLKKPEINLSNVQHFLIAETEGDLSSDEIIALDEFMKAHPEFESERKLFSKTKLIPDAVPFELKSSLKKPDALISADNINGFLIREIENDLSEAELLSLNNFISANPQFTNDRKLFAATVLKPVFESYPNKGDLKKTVALFSNTTIRYAMGIAAVLIMMVGIYFGTKTKNQNIAGNGVVTKHNDSVFLPNSVNDSLQSASPKVKRSDYVLPISKSPQPALFADKKQRKNTDTIQNKNRTKVLHETETPQNNVAKNDKAPLQENKIEKGETPVAQNNLPAAIPTISNEQPVAQNHNSTQSVSETLNNLANKKLAQLTGNNDFVNNEPTMNRKRKLLDTAAWAVNKFGGKKVKMQNQFTTSNDLMNSQITAGAFSIEHVSGE